MKQGDKKFFCCDSMLSHLYIPSWNMIFDDGDWEDKTIHYLPVFDEYGIPLHDGSSSVINIQFCPWCGKKLPESKRNEWFDRLEEKVDTAFDRMRWYLQRCSHRPALPEHSL